MRKSRSDGPRRLQPSRASRIQNRSWLTSQESLNV